MIRSVMVYSAMVIAATLAVFKIGGRIFVDFRPKQLVYAAMFGCFAIFLWRRRKPAQHR